MQVKTPEREGYLALQLGCGSKRAKQVHGRCAIAVTTLAALHCVPVALMNSSQQAARHCCILAHPGSRCACSRQHLHGADVADWQEHHVPTQKFWGSRAAWGVW